MSIASPTVSTIASTHDLTERVYGQTSAILAISDLSSPSSLTVDIAMKRGDRFPNVRATKGLTYAGMSVETLNAKWHACGTKPCARCAPQCSVLKQLLRSAHSHDYTDSRREEVLLAWKLTSNMSASSKMWRGHITCHDRTRCKTSEKIWPQERNVTRKVENGMDTVGISYCLSE